MRLRFTRSVQAPKSSPKNRYGEISAAVVMPRLRAEPVSRKTSSGSAKSVTELPRFEMVCPVQHFQKSALSRCLGACAMSTAIGCPPGALSALLLAAYSPLPATYCEKSAWERHAVPARVVLGSLP